MTSKTPVADRAEHNAFFPSAYSLEQYVPPKTDFDGADHPRVRSGPRKVLMIATDERYLRLEDGALFSTGNHPVELLLPLMHLDAAGYEIEIATISGNMAKLELWAMPAEDAAVQRAYEKFLPQLQSPTRLADARLGPDYAAVFIPGGHGAVNAIPHSPEVSATLNWALDNDRFIITLCHGPAALLATADNEGKSPFDGYSVCVFPDAIDQGPNIDIGYLPGRMRWFVAQRLREHGLRVVNDDMTGRVHQDRKLVTGDSPLASNALGRLAVTAMAESGMHN
ncbi:glyoxalase III HchA [Nocardia aurantia]|uniref:Protein/nucleic acid deglycase HchA n=1 Tax=Nocardia aurantia TaxID=2585199 RepID=A0A7K0DNW3_9NOCA|nr:glyoxalase III HchA [Nocardia aurantia]MQY27298.1 Protein/nucleic acid deglycase HchA [Nocardia aurantia]